MDLLSTKILQVKVIQAPVTNVKVFFPHLVENISVM